MKERDDLKDIPPMVPERDDVATHISNKKAQDREIVRPAYYRQKVTVSSWPVRVMLGILAVAAIAGGYGAYYFHGIYQTDIRQTNLRISDLEVALALAGESAEASDNDLMENINRTIEQYDLLWANWRTNNQQFEDMQGEMARLKMVNEGQDEATASNSQAIAATNENLLANETRLNDLMEEYNQLAQSVAALDSDVEALGSMRGDLQSIQEALSSGDSTVLGLIGRLEYMEQSMESVNAHRLQINESLFRLQENIEALQRASAEQAGQSASADEDAPVDPASPSGI